MNNLLPRDSDKWISPLLHVEHGWNDFARANYSSAEEHFSCAADAMPILDEARIGLRVSISSQWWPYRLVRRCIFRVKAESSGNRTLHEGVSWWICSAVFAVIGSSTKVAGLQQEHIWLAAAALFAMFILVKSIQYAAIIRVGQHRLGRLAVSKEDYGVLSGFICLALLLASLVQYELLGHFSAIIAALVFVFLVAPIEKVFSVNAGTPRRFMIAYFILAAGMGIAIIVDTAMHMVGKSWTEPIGSRNGFLLIGLIFIYFSAGMVSRTASGFRSFRREKVSTDIGHINLSDQKLCGFHRELYGIRGVLHDLFCSEGEPTTLMARRVIVDQLNFGYKCAAVVVSTEPLIIAVYIEEMECALLLRFDRKFVKVNSLELGSKLLAVCRYMVDVGSVGDLYDINGNSTSDAAVWPLITDFLSDDVATNNDRKNRINALHWDMAAKIGNIAIQSSYCVPRDGRPFYSFGSMDAEEEELTTLIGHSYRQSRRHS